MLPSVAGCRRFVNADLIAAGVGTALGGHHIADADVAWRFPRSLQNLLNLFATRVDQTRCFMNSGGVPELVFQQCGMSREVVNPEFFALLQQQAQP